MMIRLYDGVERRELRGQMMKRVPRLRIVEFLPSRVLATLSAAGFALAPIRAPAAEPTKIVFASGPDDTGTIGRIIEGFNAKHEGTIQVEWRQMDRKSETHFDALVDDLKAATGGIDLFASDVIWTAAMAKNRWVEDLSQRFRAEYERSAFLAMPLESATYRFKTWGVPWYTDAGLLFFRKDKLNASGYDAAPTTWAELSSVALAVMKKTQTRYGFVFEGAEYEGGTANAAEFIWSAGGELLIGRPTVTGLVVTRVVETDVVKVQSESAAQGLDTARKLVADGVAPLQVTTFKEKDALATFVAGDAVFLRSWPYASGILRKSGLTADQVGVAPLPSMSKTHASASCLGGWNLMINASSTPAERDAAWTLLRYLTSPAQQKRQVREAGLLPVVAALYDDEVLVAAEPIMALGKRIFHANLKTRPKSPFYTEMSDSIARVFNQTLRGKMTGDEAVKRLAKELRATSIRNR